MAGHSQSPSTGKLKVFIDCSGSACDGNYFRSEFNLVDFLNERTTADVHVLITSLATGGGTDQYQLIFYGQNKEEGYQDTLRFATTPNATQAEKREQLAGYLKLGLVPLIAKTMLAGAVEIELRQSIAGEPVPPIKDKWNYVVFNLNAKGSISADQNYTN